MRNKVESSITRANNQANFQGLVFYFSFKLTCGKLHLNIAAKMRNKNITEAPTPIATKSPNGHNPAQTNAPIIDAHA
jgi:hypothetical protein